MDREHYILKVSVEIRSGFAVNKYGDEIPVQEFYDAIVGEGRARLHMTPMTSRIADGNEYQSVLRPRGFKRFSPPSKPRDTIFSVLAKIGAGRV